MENVPKPENDNPGNFQALCFLDGKQLELACGSKPVQPFKLFLRGHNVIRKIVQCLLGGERGGTNASLRREVIFFGHPRERGSVGVVHDEKTGGPGSQVSDVVQRLLGSSLVYHVSSDSNYKHVRCHFIS
jgi:hypothetical protein